MSDLMKQKTVCFSGHRPGKLPDDGVIVNMLKSRLYKAVFDCIGEGKTRFVSGCALGVDLWAAQIVLDLKAEHPEIELVCVLPYKNHSASWSAAEKYQLGHILGNADESVCLSDGYRNGCFRVRNMYLVDSSSVLIAIAADMNSGTGQTVRYARKRGIEVRLICL